MTIRKKPSAAEMLTRQLKSGKRRRPPSIDDEFGQAVGRRLAERNIATVPGLPNDQPSPEWYDIALETHRQNQERRAQHEAEQEAEQLAAQSIPDLIRTALSSATKRPASAMPLNGSPVLRAALAGGSGTINNSTHL